MNAAVRVTTVALQFLLLVERVERSKTACNKMSGIEEGKSKGDLRCSSLFSVCQTLLGLLKDEDSELEC